MTSLKSAARMAVHASGVLIPFVIGLTSKPYVLAATGIITLVYILSEVLRLNGRQLPPITALTMRLKHDCEGEHFIAGPVYFAVGITLALLLFSKNIAYASVSVLAIGDPVASYVGERFGRIRVGRKTFEGFLAGLLLSFGVALLWVSPFLALVGSAVAMFLELFLIPDDNILMPVGAGLAMTATTLLSLPFA